MAVAKRRKKYEPRPPLSDLAEGIDRKGRFWIPTPQGRLLFFGGLPGEKVTVRRGRPGRRGLEQGDLLRVDEPSPLRRSAICSHYGVCGGCTLAHLEPEQALVLKAGPHYRQLRELCPEIELHPPVPSPASYSYRTKVELSFLETPVSPVSLGFHRRGRFDRLVDVHRCWLTPMDPELPDAVRAWARRWGLRGWNPRTHRGDLRYLIYRQSATDGRSLAVLVYATARPLSPEERADLERCLAAHGVDGAYLVGQSSVAGAVVPETQEHLFGETHLYETLGELRFRLDWRSFFQTNPPAYRLLLDQMKAWRYSPEGAHILDLFCGIGSIGLYLQSPADRLRGIETVEEAVVDARRNAELNGRVARFEVCSAEEALDRLDCDLLILDPPRSGCHPKLLEALPTGTTASELFYVSCNPERLQVELPELLGSYRVVQARAFDFFPQTHHLEILLHLQRR